jgi:hypothetical protein
MMPDRVRGVGGLEFRTEEGIIDPRGFVCVANDFRRLICTMQMRQTDLAEKQKIAREIASLRRQPVYTLANIRCLFDSAAILPQMQWIINTFVAMRQITVYSSLTGMTQGLIVFLAFGYFACLFLAFFVLYLIFES